MSAALDDLKDRLAKGNVVAVLGAGVSLGATGGAETAGWTGLLRHGVRRCHELYGHQLKPGWLDRQLQTIANGDVHEIIAVASGIERKLGAPDGGDYVAWLRDTVGALSVKHPETLEALRDLGVPIVTTNYDSLAEQVTGLRAATWLDRVRVERLLRGDEDAIFHFHGHWEDPGSVVLGYESYADVATDEHVQHSIRALIATRTLLYVGFGDGLEDPNFHALLDWVSSVYAGSPYYHYRLVPSGDVAPVQVKHPPEHRVRVIGSGATHTELPGFLRSFASGRSPAAPRRAANPTRDTAPSPTSWPAARFKAGTRVRAQHWVGRVQELRRLREAINDPVHGPVCIIGMAGEGKSALLARWDQQHGHELRSAGVGLFWCRPNDVGYTFDHFLADILLYLDPATDLRVLPTAELQVQHLCHLLPDHPTVIVFDGAERWLHRWVMDPSASGKRADVGDRRASERDRAFESLLCEAAVWAGRSALVVASRALPSVLDDRPHVAIGTADGPNRELAALDPSAAEELLRALGVHGSPAHLRAACEAFNFHAYTLNILGRLLVHRHGGRAESWKQLDPVRDDPEDRLTRVLDEAVSHHADSIDLLTIVACCLAPAPVPMIAALLPCGEVECARRLDVLRDWQLIEFDGTRASLHALMSHYFMRRLDPGTRRRLLGRMASWFRSRPTPDAPLTPSDVEPRILAIRHAIEADELETADVILRGSASVDRDTGFADWLSRFGYLPLAEATADLSRATAMYEDLVHRQGRTELFTELAATYNNRAIALTDLGRFAEAGADFARAAEIYDNLIHRDGRQELLTDLAATCSNRAIALTQLGEFTSAAADFTRAVEIYDGLVRREGRADLQSDLASALALRAQALLGRRAGSARRP
jgi:hypothetical protein